MVCLLFPKIAFFWYLFSLHPIPVGGGGSTCPHPFFGHFWLILKFFFTKHFFRQNPTTFVKDIFFQNCKKVFKITFENFHFRAIDQSINQNTKYRIFAPHFWRTYCDFSKKLFFTKSSSFLLLKWLVKKKNSKKCIFRGAGMLSPPPHRNKGANTPTGLGLKQNSNMRTSALTL